MGIFDIVEFNKPRFVGYKQNGEGHNVPFYSVIFPDHLPLGSETNVSAETLEIRALQVPPTPTFEEWMKG